MLFCFYILLIILAYDGLVKPFSLLKYLWTFILWNLSVLLVRFLMIHFRQASKETKNLMISSFISLNIWSTAFFLIYLYGIQNTYRERHGGFQFWGFAHFICYAWSYMTHFVACRALVASFCYVPENSSFHSNLPQIFESKLMQKSFNFSAVFSSSLTAFWAFRQSVGSTAVVFFQKYFHDFQVLVIKFFQFFLQNAFLPF